MNELFWFELLNTIFYTVNQLQEQAKQSEEQAKRMEEQAKKMEEQTEQLVSEFASLREAVVNLATQIAAKWNHNCTINAAFLVFFILSYWVSWSLIVTLMILIWICFDFKFLNVCQCNTILD